MRHEEFAERVDKRLESVTDAVEDDAFEGLLPSILGRGAPRLPLEAGTLVVFAEALAFRDLGHHESLDLRQPDSRLGRRGEVYGGRLGMLLRT